MRARRRIEPAAVVVATLLLTGCSGIAPDTTANPTPTPALPSWAPDQPLILASGFTGAGGGVFIVDPDDPEPVRIATDVDGVHKHPAWAPDGQTVVFIDDTSERMYVAHLDGLPTESLAVCDEPGCDNPAFSPDGTEIAFSRYSDAAGVTGPASVGIFVVTLDSGDVREIVTLSRPLLADRPRWSPDGSRIVFGVDRMDGDANETGAAIAVVDAAGGEPTILTDFALFGYSPDWGPDDRIVFSEDVREYDPASNPDAPWNLHEIRSDGSGLRTITQAAERQHYLAPRWTPDGTGITAYDNSIPDGVLIDPETGSPTDLPTGRDLARPQMRSLP